MDLVFKVRTVPKWSSPQTLIVLTMMCTTYVDVVNTAGTFYFLSTPIPTGPDDNFIACSVEHKWQMKAGCNALIRIIIFLFFPFQTRHSVILPQHLTAKEKA